MTDLTPLHPVVANNLVASFGLKEWEALAATPPAGAEPATTADISRAAADAAPALAALGWADDATSAGFTLAGLARPALVDSDGGRRPARWVRTARGEHLLSLRP